MKIKCPSFAWFGLWNSWGVSYHWYLSRRNFIAFPQQHASCLSAASATTKNIFDSILEVPAARVVLFSEGLHCCIGNYNNHLPPKKTVTCRAPATSCCYGSELSTPKGRAGSELQKGGSELSSKRGSRQQEAKGRQRILNRKANQMLTLSSFCRGQPMADFSHVYRIAAVKQASLWDEGLMRGRKFAIVLEIIYYVLIK